MRMNKKRMKKINVIVWLSVGLCMLCGCARTGHTAGSETGVRVVIEEGEGFTAQVPCAEVLRGGDVTFSLQMAEGYLFDGTDYTDYKVDGDGKNVKLVLKNVRYPAVVTVYTKKGDLAVSYHANGGLRCDGGDETAVVTLPVIASHQRVNTSTGTGLFYREGYTLTGWNTMADGSGVHIGLGSRTDALAKDTMTPVLYAEWEKWTKDADFRYEVRQNWAVITGYAGHEKRLVIPGSLGGYPVVSIETGAFAQCTAETVVFPLSLQTIEAEAFADAAVREIYLYDNIVSVNDYAFSGCTELRTLRVNAVEAPVYSGTYYDTFQDKYDRLLSLKDEKKIVLFSGSSARFGYDSAMIDAAFADYEVVNMGVFAYTNAAPQLMLILDCMNPGDILLHSPEFDAAKRQFCTNSDLDAAFFCMMESNYDAAAQLDLRMFDKTFSALCSYLRTKSTMPAKSYALSAADFDEDGNMVEQKSYNSYGDYVCYRKNSAHTGPVYGLEVAYTKAAFPKAQYLDPVNAMYERFLEKEIKVYVTYAPRNRYAVSKESTQAARAQLDRYLREELIVPVISDIEKSLFPGTYLYGTDNHLSTEGVLLRTEDIIADLKAQLALEGVES